MAQQQGRSPEVDAELKKLQGVQNGQCPCVVLLQVIARCSGPRYSNTVVHIRKWFGRDSSVVCKCDTSRVLGARRTSCSLRAPHPEKIPAVGYPQIGKQGDSRHAGCRMVPNRSEIPLVSHFSFFLDMYLMRSGVRRPFGCPCHPPPQPVLPPLLCCLTAYLLVAAFGNCVFFSYLAHER